jgi:hypothetical protein
MSLAVLWLITNRNMVINCNCIQESCHGNELVAFIPILATLEPVYGLINLEGLPVTARLRCRIFFNVQ